jgi:hypothetical protein
MTTIEEMIDPVEILTGLGAEMKRIAEACERIAAKLTARRVAHHGGAAPSYGLHAPRFADPRPLADFLAPRAPGEGKP